MRGRLFSARTGPGRLRVLLAVVLGVAVFVPVQPQPVHYGPLPVLNSLPIDPRTDPDVRELCPAASRRPVPDGKPIRVVLTPAPPFTAEQFTAGSLRKLPVADPTWQMRYLGLMWMGPLARRAAQDGQLDALSILIRQAVLFHQLNPDPHRSEHGWDEGTALNRLKSENCLYALTRAPELVPGMAADVAVLTGDRYYGPPNVPVTHNHGLMANLRMIAAGKLTGRPEWITKAADRLVAEAPAAFSAQGVTLEQASTYQVTNTSLWTSAATALESLPGYADHARRIRATVQKAQRIESFMTEPDGRLVQVGDSDAIAGRPRKTTGDLVLRDDQAGWVIGRTSWTDPDAVYYTVRYGPKRWAHGQQNRAGGVTWSALGTRVLTGTGRYSYDDADELSGYRRTPESQNVAAPVGATIVARGTSTVTSSDFGAAEHRITVADTVYGPPHTRQLSIRQNQARLSVTDTFTGVEDWAQNWHLDPAWELVTGSIGGQDLTFENPAGRRLTITTTGRVTGVWCGSGDSPQGWVSPRLHVKKAAYQLSLGSAGGAPVTTVFQLS